MELNWLHEQLIWHHATLPLSRKRLCSEQFNDFTIRSLSLEIFHHHRAKILHKWKMKNDIMNPEKWWWKFFPGYLDAHGNEHGFQAPEMPNGTKVRFILVEIHLHRWRCSEKRDPKSHGWNFPPYKSPPGLWWAVKNHKEKKRFLFLICDDLSSCDNCNMQKKKIN